MTRSVPVLRVARLTDDLDRVTYLYRDGLGLSVLYRFKDHDGFDGVMLGLEGGPYHLEFTRAKGHAVGRAPTRDNLLVFYIPERSDWEAAVSRMRAAGFRAVASFNPYWDLNGVTFEDPDGYRVVLANAAGTFETSQAKSLARRANMPAPNSEQEATLKSLKDKGHLQWLGD